MEFAINQINYILKYKVKLTKIPIRKSKVLSDKKINNFLQVKPQQNYEWVLYDSISKIRTDDSQVASQVENDVTLQNPLSIHDVLSK